MAQAFQPAQVFRHSLERLCYRLEKLVGNDEPLKGKGVKAPLFDGMIAT